MALRLLFVNLRSKQKAKISKMSDIFKVENIGYISRIYIMDIYHANSVI